MIEVLRRRLEPREQERWRALLAHTPIVARPSPFVEPELLLFVMWVCGSLLVATFDPLVTAPSWFVSLMRLTWAAVVLACGRGALWMWRARRATWENRVALFAWGYVHVEHDALRAIRVEDLVLEVEGRWLGIGPIRLRLRSDAWSTTLWLTPDELSGIAHAIHAKASGLADLETAGYRGGAVRIGGATAPRRVSRRRRELAWVLGGALVALCLPCVPPVPSDQLAPAATAPQSSATASPARVSRRLRAELASCSDDELVVASIESYLTLALTTPRLGPARPSALRVETGRQAPGRAWAHCAWEVDAARGTFSRAHAWWARDEERRPAREVTVEVADVLDVIARCHASDARFELSPRGIAVASVALLRAAIALHAPEALGDGETASSAIAACVAPTLPAVVTRIRE